MKGAQYDIQIQEIRYETDPKQMTTRDLTTLRNSIDNAERDFNIFKTMMKNSLKNMKEDGL